MEMQWSQQEKMGLHQVGDADEFKRILTDTNPYLLGVTAVVSVLHMLFDFLAFKVTPWTLGALCHGMDGLAYPIPIPLFALNDIQFWRNNKSMVGLSIKKLGTDCFVGYMTPLAHAQLTIGVIAEW